jgi:hypothetical protein
MPWREFAGALAHRVRQGMRPHHSMVTPPSAAIVRSSSATIARLLRMAVRIRQNCRRMMFRRKAEPASEPYPDTRGSQITEGWR